ncbi:DUF3179 domain-containing protein [Candidatus Peregrinibacteria bacterium]|nr:DUF3179 domain-containing protein [Candidatus Peregrinibacteria bacterium]
MKIFLSIFGIFLLLAGSVVASMGYDNFKLKLTRFWGYATIQNNPLLSSYDEDLKVLDTLRAEQLLSPKVEESKSEKVRKLEGRKVRGVESRELESEKVIINSDIAVVDNIENPVKKKSEDYVRIDLNDLLSGGPGKEGIPSLDDPEFVSSDETEFSDDELIIGVYLNGEAKAYPYGIMNWHEIVNDTVGGVPVSVTYCPLCETNSVFVRRVNGKETTFGVSGKLFQSCLVMYGRLTDSLWSQPWGMGVVGEQVDNHLERVLAYRTTLGEWKKKHVNTLVLSSNTGHNRNYFSYPYGSYYTNDDLIFPARNQDKLGVHPKEIEQYVWKADERIPHNEFGGVSVHFTQSEIKEKRIVPFEFGSKKGKAVWNKELSAIDFIVDGKVVPSTSSFGFVCPAFFE